jgi:hypothetical protein
MFRHQLNFNLKFGKIINDYFTCLGINLTLTSGFIKLLMIILHVQVLT